MSYFLKGSRSFFRSVEVSDYPSIAAWLNDGVVTKFMVYGQRPMSQEQVADMMRQQVNGQHCVFMVCDLASGRAIGFAGLYDLHFTARKAELRLLIGEMDFWGKGYGTEVTEMLTFYGFDRLNLNKVYLGVVADNRGAVRTYEKAGYVREGLFRDEVFRNGRYYDAIKMSLLAKEYRERFFATHQTKFTS